MSFLALLELTYRLEYYVLGVVLVKATHLVFVVLFCISNLYPRHLTSARSNLASF